MYGASDPAEAQSPFTAEARRKLEATTDPVILLTAGEALTMRLRGSTDAETVALGRNYLERAVQLDPQNVRARAMLSNFFGNERRREIEGRLRASGARDAFDEFSDNTYAAVSALPEQDRLVYLPSAAESTYMRAESVDYTAPEKLEAERPEARKRAAQGFARSRQYANDLLALAQRHREAPGYGDAIYRANTVLGVLALKDGDRRKAVEHMRTAAAAPISEETRYTPHYGLRGRLVEYLLREGERESVAEFLQKSAERFLFERERLLKDAAQIRAGIMPSAFQSAEARK
jgi:hypothetical protein